MFQKITIVRSLVVQKIFPKFPRVTSLELRKNIKYHMDYKIKSNKCFAFKYVCYEIVAKDDTLNKAEDDPKNSRE